MGIVKILGPSVAHNIHTRHEGVTAHPAPGALLVLAKTLDLIVGGAMDGTKLRAVVLPDMVGEANATTGDSATP